MHKSTRIFWLICAALVGAGLVLSVIGLAAGGHRHLADLEQRYDWINFGGGETRTEIQELSAFSDIAVDCGTGTVRFIAEKDTAKGAAEYRAEVTFREKEGAPSVKVKNGKLTVSDKNVKNHYLVNFDFLGEPAEETVLNIYYPAEKKQDSVKIDCDMGTADVSGVRAENVEIDCASGEVLMADLAADFLRIHADLGSIRGENLRTKGMNLEVQSGEIGLYGIFRGKNRISCDTGECNIRTKLPQSAYDIDTKIDVGEVIVNGETAHGKYRVQNQKAKNSFDLTCDYGEISLDFV